MLMLMTLHEKHFDTVATENLAFVDDLPQQYEMQAFPTFCKTVNHFIFAGLCHNMPLKVGC